MDANERKWRVLYALEDNKARFGYDAVAAVVMWAQSALESANWTSPLCERSNNCFGMGFPTQRPTTAKGWTPGENGAHMAVYDTPEDSAIDYLMRQQYWHIPASTEPLDYIASTVATGYATDPSYAPKWAAKVEALNANPGTPWNLESRGGKFPVGLALIGLLGLWATSNR